ncbi:MAG TPA: hypothetical protein VLE94_02530 [Burkholderiaceae bacterium]|nr:hypothetical protein [Burkholderiaceae bacterium]
MNAIAAAPAESTRLPMSASTPRSTAPTGSWPAALPPRATSVWDERARKMGFPPSSR